MLRTRLLLAFLILLVTGSSLRADPVYVPSFSPGDYYVEWYYGCAPTSGGCMFAYWNDNGFPNLIENSVEEAIATESHITTFYEDPIVGDRGSTWYGSTNDPGTSDGYVDNCIADFMGTSRFKDEGLSNGGSWPGWDVTSGDIGDRTIGSGLVDFAEYRGYSALVNVWEHPGTLGGDGLGTWEALVAEIDAGRPVMFGVDSDADGKADHAVPVFGYDEDTHQYYAYSEWGSDPFAPGYYGAVWSDFTGTAAGVEWGVGTMITMELEGGENLVYVDQDAAGGNNGTSWADAYVDLQTALANAQTGDHVWVAEGTYTPTSTTDRTVSFTIPHGVHVYGGFMGTETRRGQRVDGHTTVLSGDIGVVGTTSDNAYHVVVMGKDVALDTLTIQDGNADGLGQYALGGGIYCSGGSGSVNACKVLSNAAEDGGGLYNGNGDLRLEGVTFQYNTAQGDGGGILGAGAADLTLISCVVQGNYADTEAGCGGGICFRNGALSLKEVTCEQNGAAEGGGLYASGLGQTLTTQECTFKDNEAGKGGGAFLMDLAVQADRVTLTSNEVAGGIGTGYGGGLYLDEVSGYFVSSVCRENTAGRRGGGVYFGNSSTVSLINCTLYGNTASLQGGALYLRTSASPAFANTILWNNAAPLGGAVLYDDGTTTQQFSHCDIEGSGGSGAGWDADLGTDSGSNIDVDPDFRNAGGGDLRLNIGSPCIEAGDSSAVPEDATSDCAGKVRIQDSAVDIGAYEGRASTPTALTNGIAVSGDSSDGNDIYHFDVPADVVLVQVTTTVEDNTDIVDLGVNLPSTGDYPDAVVTSDTGEDGATAEGNETLRLNTTSSPVVEDDGRYYILVERWGDGGAYAVTASYAKNQLDEWDPGDDSSGGATLLLPTEAVQSHGTHFLGTSDSVDWYRVNMVEGWTYHFDSVGGAGDSYAELYNESDLATPVSSDDDSGLHGQFSMDYTAPTTGTYYLKVRAFSLGDVWGGSINYSVSAEAEEDDSFEENDMFADAATVSSTSYHNLHCRDADYYRLYLPEDVDLTVSITFGNVDGDLELRLLDENQALLDSSETANDEEVVYHTTASAGYYTIYVYGYQGARNQYSMTVQVDTKRCGIHLKQVKYEGSASIFYQYEVWASGDDIAAGSLISPNGDSYVLSNAGGGYWTATGLEDSATALESRFVPGDYDVDLRHTNGALTTRRFTVWTPPTWPSEFPTVTVPGNNTQIDVTQPVTLSWDAWSAPGAGAELYLSVDWEKGFYERWLATTAVSHDLDANTLSSDDAYSMSVWFRHRESLHFDFNKVTSLITYSGEVPNETSKGAVRLTRSQDVDGNVTGYAGVASIDCRLASSVLLELPDNSALTLAATKDSGQGWYTWSVEYAAATLAALEDRFPDGVYTFVVTYIDGTSSEATATLEGDWPASYPEFTSTQVSERVIAPDEKQTFTWRRWSGGDSDDLVWVQFANRTNGSALTHLRSAVTTQVTVEYDALGEDEQYTLHVGFRANNGQGGTKECLSSMDVYTGEPGAMTVTSTPSGAMVTIVPSGVSMDGVQSQLTPVTEKALLPGNYDVRAEYMGQVQTATGQSVTQGATTAVGFTFSGNSVPVAVAALSSPVTPRAEFPVTLTGSSSYDPDGDAIEAYQWIQKAGYTVALSDATAMMPTFTPSQAGLYVFTLSVTDAYGNVSEPASSPDYLVSVTVEDALAYTVSGTIVANGTPQPSVWVDLFTSTGTWVANCRTDGDGRYTFSGVAPGDYNIYAYEPVGFSPVAYEGNVFTLSGDMTTANVSLASTYAVAGTVTSSGAAVAGAWVDLLSEGGSWLANTQTDANGQYSLGPVGDGNYTVRVYTPGSMTPVEYGALVVVAGSNRSGIDIELSLASLSGTVTIAGAPAPYAWVDLFTDAGAWVSHTQTDGDGQYTFNAVSSGTYNVTAYAPETTAGTSSTANPVSVSSADVTGVDVSLGSGIVLGGTVSKLGTAVADVWVDLFDDSGVWLNHVQTDGQGQYRFVLAAVGTYQIKAYEPQSLFAANGITTSVAATPASVTTLDIPLTCYTITGTVTRSGVAVADAWLDIFTTAGVWMGHAQTDASGQYSLGPVAQDSYKVVLYDPANGNAAVEYSANPITIQGGVEELEVVSGVDFEL